jgi:hypothetical protein
MAPHWRASRAPVKGALLAARLSRFRGSLETNTATHLAYC